ncbi:Endonuclease/exonuclease/phosphatase [Aspergillus karnatakaensis]|uniref:inositol phosphosphingolipid phospholipase n=1 Tax=Aspergillus karnatakaensis TaxID=1810916 RepID=UPI003CCE4FC4
MNDPDPDPSSIRILTLNCWGLKYIAKYRNERLSEIGRQLSLSSPPPDIIGLQECWTQQDYESIRSQTAHILPYAKFYYGGIWGAGLAIFSRWPIEQSSMYEYPLNGRPTAFFRGDWFVGKGVACARIRYGSGVKDVAEVFCTHLHAPYEQEPHDSYLAHRTAQAWEIAKLMRGAAERGHLVIGLGDFNMLPSSFAHRLICAHSPVVDVWQVMYPDSSVGAAKDAVEKARGKPVPEAGYNLNYNGATCDGPYNTWRWEKRNQKRLDKGHDITVDATTPDLKGKRLDYIFVGEPESSGWTVAEANITMTQRHPTLRCSLSDHFAVEAVITRSPSSSKKDYPPSEKTAPTALTLPSETYTHILSMIDTYVLRERKQRRWRLAHFVTSVLVTIGCLVGVWWNGDRPYIPFILTLVSSLGLAAGVLDGLIGGLFVSSEIRALKEFEWEIRNTRALVGGVEAGEE